jgi:hypothetical protein
MSVVGKALACWIVVWLLPFNASCVINTPPALMHCMLLVETSDVVAV